MLEKTLKLILDKLDTLGPKGKHNGSKINNGTKKTRGSLISIN